MTRVEEVESLQRDRNGMLVLSREECMRRLGRGGLGRVAVTVAALPAIFPVNYAVDDGDIYFRTAEGTKLWAAAHNSVVAFEIDSIDVISHTGWSVMVVGSASEVTDPDDVDRLRALPLTRWLRGGSPSLVRVQASLVSGRDLTNCSES